MYIFFCFEKAIFVYSFSRFYETRATLEGSLFLSSYTFVYISIMLDKVEVHKITKRKKINDFKINTCSVLVFLFLGTKPLSLTSESIGL